MLFETSPSAPIQLKNRPVVLAGGLDKASARHALAAVPANPDPVERLRDEQPLNASGPSTFHAPGAEGDYRYPTFVAKP